jgi:NADPH:quinone reductase-like Zn-dependent oxidoreductase
MKAAVYHRYGSPDVIQIEDVEKPVPAEGEVLVKVRAAAVNPLDSHLMRGRPYVARLAFGLRMPKHNRPGVDVAGEIEAVGDGVKEFKPGDAVFGSCRGAFAEYVAASANAVVRKPENVTFEQAAAVPVAAFTALQGLRDKAKVRPGQRVLVNGAAGGVGTLAVQVAAWLGAEVTGVCSTRNVEMVRALGAAKVVDYTREDFTRSSERYDVIFDLIANHPVSAFRRALSPRGKYIVAGALGGPDGLLLGPLGYFLRVRVLSLFSSRELTSLLANPNREDLLLTAELLAAGKLKPVIDRRYSLDETAEALRYLKTGHARGKVLITPAG